MTRDDPAAAANLEFVLTRVLPAPREAVWEAWTDPERIRHWWGPKGFVVHGVTMDLRPGGIFHYGMKGPNGTDMWGKFTYRGIVPPERLEFINCFSNEAGDTVRAPFSDPWPQQLLTTITFADRDGGTAVTVRWVPHEATYEERATFAAGMDSMEQGWTGTFDQLEAYLARTVE